MSKWKNSRVEEFRETESKSEPDLLCFKILFLALYQGSISVRNKVFYLSITNLH